jgi:hypothetical protein
MIRQHAVEIVPGWFLGTNISNQDKVRLLRRACDALGLEFGDDLKSVWVTYARMVETIRTSSW